MCGEAFNSQLSLRGKCGLESTVEDACASEDTDASYSLLYILVGTVLSFVHIRGALVCVEEKRN